MKNFMNKPTVLVETGGIKTPIRNYMATNLITFTPDSNVMDVVNALLEKRITGAPVLNDRKEVVGMIDDKTCLKLLVASEYYNSPLSEQTVSNYMDDVLTTVKEDISISEAANIFLETKYKRLIVVDENGKLAGQISRRDILRAIRDINT
ncbi:MAG TPA: CBS domain-containing protein, partial [Saprospiraceae bacterium]|nr:CBS domain-containing protein [Saprospiraceae bacterium]